MSRHQDVFEEFAETVEQQLGDRVERIVLFGSVARGEEREESDVDVLVVVDDKSVKEDVFEISYDLLLEEDVYVSPKVVSAEEYRRMEDREKSFLDRIQPEMSVYGQA